MHVGNNLFSDKFDNGVELLPTVLLFYLFFINLFYSLSDENDRRKCRFRDDDGCYFEFTYRYDDNAVEALKDKGTHVEMTCAYIIFIFH